MATPVISRMTDNAMVQTWRISAIEPLAGQMVRIDGLASTMTDALVRIEFIDGGEWVGRLTPGAPQATIPARQDGWAVAATYLKLGVEHIMLGIDHLLFVLALILIAPSTRQLILAITAFTVAHSITLAAAALGFVNVPPPPIEATIALSIAFVAAEIIRAREGKAGIAARAPWVVAFAFGLLHGFGFAGALSEVGLPAGHIPLALFSSMSASKSVSFSSLQSYSPRRSFSARAAPTAPLGCSRTALSHWHARHVLGDPTRVSVLNKCSGGDIT